MMKKIYKLSAFIAASTITIFSLLSCGDMQIPESISVATDAEFNVNLGTLKYNLSDTLNTQSITEQMQESLGNKMGLYSYLPDNNPLTDDDESDILSYLIHYPVYEVPIDVGSYLNDLDFSSVFGSTDFDFNFEQSVSIPALSENGTKQLEMNIIEDFHSSVSTTLHSNDFDIISVPESGSATLNAEDYLKDGNGVNHKSIVIQCDAEKLYYKSGSAIKMDFTQIDSNIMGEDFSFKLRATISSDEDGTNVLTQSSNGDYTELRTGGTILLPLDCSQGLPEQFYILLKGEITGGTIGTIHKYSAAMSLSDGSAIKKIENIKKTSSELGIDSEVSKISVSTDSINGWFKTASIKEGSIVLSTDSPSNWSKVQTDVSVKFGGDSIPAGKITDGENASSKLFDKVIDLSGITLTPTSEPIEIETTVSVEIYGADITFDDSADTENLSILYSYSISKLSNVAIELKDSSGNKNPKYENLSLKFELDQNGTGNYVELSSELTQYVKQITFGEQSDTSLSENPYYKHNGDKILDTTLPCDGLGFRFNVVNTMPTDDIAIKIKSDLMNFDLETTLPETDESGAEEKWVNHPVVDFTSLAGSSDPTYVDFSFEIVSDTITLDEVTLGDTYKFGLQFKEMIYDWDYVELNSEGTSMSGSNNLDSFDLSSLLSGLSLDDSSIKNIRITTLPVYFYAQKPVSDNASLTNLLNGLSIQGSVSIDYEYKGESYTEGDALTAEKLEIFNNETLSFTGENVPWPADVSTIIASEETIASKKEEGKTYSSEILPFIDDTLVVKKYSFKSDLADIINKTPETMTFNYELSLTNSNGGSATVYSSWFDTEEGTENASAGINIDMAVLLSFDLSLIGNININIMDFFSEDWETSDSDLLYRNGADDYEEYVKYCDAIEYFRLNYRVENNLFNGLDLSAQVKDEVCSIDKQITLKQNQMNTLSLTSSEIERVLTNYPFHPSALITILGGTELEPKKLSISKTSIDSTEGACLGAEINLELNMTDSCPIKVWGDKD